MEQNDLFHPGAPAGNLTEMHLSVVFKFVADAPYSGNIPAGRLWKFLTKSFDVDVYSTGITNIIITPDIVQKLFTGKYLIWVGC